MCAEIRDFLNMVIPDDTGYPWKFVVIDGNDAKRLVILK
jgi:hypothetical protein